MLAPAVIFVLGVVDAQRSRARAESGRRTMGGEAGGESRTVAAAACTTAPAFVAGTECFFDGVVQSHVRHFKIPFNLWVWVVSRYVASFEYDMKSCTEIGLVSRFRN
jgi:hypothetical protein